MSSNTGSGARSLRHIHQLVAFKAGVAEFLAGLPHSERKPREQMVYECGRLTAAHLIAKGKKISGPADVYWTDAESAWLENSYPRADLMTEVRRYLRRSQPGMGDE